MGCNGNRSRFNFYVTNKTEANNEDSPNVGRGGHGSQWGDMVREVVVEEVKEGVITEILIATVVVNKDILPVIVGCLVEGYNVNKARMIKI